MSLTITATIVDPDGKPRALLGAQVCLFGPAGSPKLLASGQTDKLGKLELATRLVVGEYLPRLQLLLLRGETWVEIREPAALYTDTACDFGTLEFSATQPVDDGMAPRDGGDLEGERAALIKDLETQFSATLADALAARTSELAADKAAALAALAQQLAADKAAALAATTSELIAARDAALAARTEELNADKALALAAQAEQHAEALAAEAAKVSALLQQLAAGDDPHESSIEDLAQTAASQLQRVRQTLQDGQSGLRLGKVALQLKVMAGRTGGSVALPQTRQIEKVGAGALGSLDLAFIPETAAPAARPQLTAPRVLGYTEALARRKLAERRLGVELVYRLVTSAAEHGRVVLQRPEPAAPVAEGAVVLIAIGRQAEHDPRPS
jgi:hypothetical protein